MESRNRNRWRPTRGETIFLVASGAASLFAALTGAFVSYRDDPVQLFRTPVWVLILVGAAVVYLLRVRLRTRSDVDERSDDFFSRD